jgi:hypothetical protein
MARRVNVDYSYVGFRRGSRKRRWRRFALLSAGAVFLLAFGLIGGRAAWHALRDKPAANSHALTSAQRGSLKQIANPAADDSGDRSLRLGGGARTSPTPAPPGAVLSIPYTVQAPFGNWKVFENACEEAALLMYHDYLQGDHRDQIPPAEADPALRAMEKWQVDNWGAERDLTLDKTGQLAQAYYGYRYEVIAATKDAIAAHVAAGHPVIVPVMTHSLQNSHYGRMTVYHELLIKGYSPDGVVTNDAGVQEGKDWFYSWSVLFGAIDAQAPKLGQGRVALVLTK